MKLFLFMSLLLLASSCTHVMFTAPQPEGTQSLTEFPGDFRGIFVDRESQGDTLIIAAREVTFIDWIEREIQMEQLSEYSNIEVKGNKLYDSEDPQNGWVTFEVRDSVMHYTTVDRSSIGISDSMTLRLMKHYLVVNMQTTEDDKTYWDVALAEMKDKRFLSISTIGEIKTPDTNDQEGPFEADLETFNKISPYTRLKEDTYVFEPSKSDFHKMVKKGLFRVTDTFEKVR